MPKGFGYGPDAGKKKKGGPQMGHSPAEMGHKDSAMKMGHKSPAEMSPYKMGHESPAQNHHYGKRKGESVKQERKDLLTDNPVAKDASGGRSWMSKHATPLTMGHESPAEMHCMGKRK
jgi:hypothetical protein